MTYQIQFTSVAERQVRKLRVGDYRVIYAVFDAELKVTVLRAAHRREVYYR